MTIKARTAFLIGLSLVSLWFLYIERVILTPFIIGVIFAYLFNPVVNFFGNKIKLPRVISIIIIDVAIISLIVFLSQFITKQIIEEQAGLKSFVNNFSKTATKNINSLPLWIRPPIEDALSSLENLKFITPTSIFSFFPKALFSILGFIIFLFSGFYFLKDGRKMFDKFLNFIPQNYRVEVEILLRKINNVLNAYLRGQILLIILVSVMLFIALTILGVKFALILAIFSGIVEIIPIIGPTIAIITSSTVAFIAGDLNFSLTPISGAITVAIVYLAIRQFQDYFINPLVLGRITKLHPLIILFAVLAGEHTAGIMGIIVAVPIAATIKIILEFTQERIMKTTSANKK